MQAPSVTEQIAAIAAKQVEAGRLTTTEVLANAVKAQQALNRYEPGSCPPPTKWLADLERLAAELGEVAANLDRWIPPLA